MAYLAIASWSLGDVDRAISLIDASQTRIAGVTHVGTRTSANARGHVRTDARRPLRAPRRTPSNLLGSRAEHDLSMWRAFGVFLEGWAAAQSGALDERARGHAPRRRAAARTERRAFRRAIQDCAGRSRSPRRAMPTAPLRSSTKRWRRANGLAIAHSKRNCIGPAAKSCSSATPRTPRPPRKPS